MRHGVFVRYLIGQGSSVYLMNDIHAHVSPTFSDAAKQDALFHYTDAQGLLGILTRGEIWSTAYYCANDETELSAGSGVLWPVISTLTQQLVASGDKRIQAFSARGVNPYEYAKSFEKHISSMVLHTLCAYITCFCTAGTKEEFTHGLLSQWRGYGSDGGYALQFSKAKLQEEIDRTNDANGTDYYLADVDYEKGNVKQQEVLKYESAFRSAYEDFLDLMAEPFGQNAAEYKPLSSLVDGPLSALLDYLIYTKNEHFREERECRLSVIQPIKSSLPQVYYFNRRGMLVPFVKTSSDSFDILRCLEWVVVGPSPRINSRCKSVLHLVKSAGIDAQVRPSHIPYSRY